MASTIKGTLEVAGHKIAETATKVGHKISEGAEKVGDWAKEKVHQASNRASEGAQQAKDAAKEACTDSCGPTTATSNIQPHMDVLASCGKRIGAVDHLDGNSIKLTKNDSTSGGQHHWIPTDWVSKVDNHVHLNKNSEEAMQGWKTEGAACSSCS